MNNVLITGANGFVGTHLIKRFVNDGIQVHAIIRANSNVDSIKNDCILHVHDGTTENMFEIIKGIKPELVVHLAASFNKNEHMYNNIDSLIKTNISFGVQLVQSMVMNNVKYMINTGTSWQHYEDRDYNPICLYSATKQAFQDILKYYTEATELRVLTLKLFHTYGPNDRRNKLFCQLRNAIKGNTILNMTPGEQLIDIVYIDDVIKAYKIASDRLEEKKGLKMEEFIVSSGKHISLKKLVRTYYGIMNEDEKINWGGNKYRPREEMKPYTNGAILPKWKPQVMIEQGIRIMEGLL